MVGELEMGAEPEPNDGRAPAANPDDPPCAAGIEGACGAVGVEYGAGKQHSGLYAEGKTGGVAERIQLLECFQCRIHPHCIESH